MSLPPLPVVRLALLLPSLVGVLLPALLVLAGAFLLLVALDGLVVAAVVFLPPVDSHAASPSFFFVDAAVTVDAAVLFFVFAFSPCADDATEAFVSGLTMVSSLLVTTMIPPGTAVSFVGFVLMNFVQSMNAKCEIQQQRSIMWTICSLLLSLVVRCLLFVVGFSMSLSCSSLSFLGEIMITRVNHSC